MSEEKKELAKKEKLEKARSLIEELNKLELSEEELKEVAGGSITNEKTPGVY
ncbi:MAG: hypothetical protein GY780_04165 [bacterium]|nr:hypothetical protein [bacterium]